MITNEKQYRITQSQAAKFKQALENFDPQAAVKEGLDPLFAEAHLEALRSELDVLSAQLADYEELKSGKVKAFKAETLRDLPKILIKARIARGMTQRALADAVGLKEQQIQRYEAEYYRTASLQRLIEIADALSVKITKRAELISSNLIEDTDPIDWDRFPVREMCKRGWFEDFSGTPAQARAQAETLVPLFFKNAGASEFAFALHRKQVRSGAEMDQHALLAWQARVICVANEQNLPAEFCATKLDHPWLKELVKLSASPDGPRKAIDRIQGAGIHVVVEPRLPRTHLDGAAIRLQEGRPIIGITLRQDRLDNFWFVLLHELAHVLLHFQKNEWTVIFDDVESDPETKIEEEADKFAQNALIPDEIWETSIARYTRSPRAVESEAARLGINPAIIAGRIRREANDYTILNNMVGQGQVRKLFPEVSFAD